MDTQTRIGIGAGAFFALAGICSPWVGWWTAAPVMILCLGLVVWGSWPLVKFEASIPWPLWHRDLALPDAMSKLYGLTRGTDMADFAERASKNDPAEILDWYAYWLALHSVPIYGKRIPSTIEERLPPEVILPRLHFAGGARCLVGGHPRQTIYHELKVRRSDIRNHWKALLHDDFREVLRQPAPVGDGNML